MKQLIGHAALTSVRAAIFFCSVNLYTLWAAKLNLPTIPSELLEQFM
jgi:hypothetical protein